MPSTPITSCEVEVNGQWQLIDQLRQHLLLTAKLRCPSCMGEMRVVGAFTSTGRPHARHVQRNNGCRLSGYRFDGDSRPHPNALT